MHTPYTNNSAFAPPIRIHIPPNPELPSNNLLNS